ncbi:MAG: low molecular weight phosphotyrosine protein phosphatase [Alistipes sp.]|nr:low molecular weight phosphotyrosine protein phosphatase [Alistipes sp.]
MNPSYKILFVCLGNICRSPSAEAVFRDTLQKAGMAQQIEIDSAGIIGYHEGEAADARMQRHAAQRGYRLTSISRPIRATDFDRFDLVIGMDDQNLRDLRRKMPPRSRAKICKMTDFCVHRSAHEVPDPYYGGAAGFEQVLDLLEDASQGLLQHLQSLLPSEV